MIGVIKGTMRQAKEVSGLPLPIASYKANLKAPYRSLKVAITAKQSGSGDPSPDNIRPISGFSECNVVACGKNLFSYDLPIRNGYWTNDSFVGDNAIVPKEKAVIWQYIRVYVEGLSSITLSGFDNQGGTNCAWLSSENVNDVISRFNSLNKNGTKIVPSGAKYLCLTMFNIKDKSTTYPNAQLEVGSTATAYEAYTGNTYTIQLGDTYYGGSLDVTNGVMTVNWVELAGGWSQYAQNNGYKAYRSNTYFRTKTSTSALCNMVNKYGAFSSASMNKNIIQLPSTQWTFAYVALDENVDVSTLQLVYELATPITVQLTPTQVEQLLGQNNVWADTGDVEELKYTDRQVYYGR